MPLELELCPGRWVGGQHPCFIIAEIGQNHQGDLDVAKRMIRMAKVRGLSRVYLAGSLGCCTLTPGRWGGNRDPWEVTASSAGAVVAGSSVAART